MFNLPFIKPLFSSFNKSLFSWIFVLLILYTSISALEKMTNCYYFFSTFISSRFSSNFFYRHIKKFTNIDILLVYFWRFYKNFFRSLKKLIWVFFLQKFIKIVFCFIFLLKYIIQVSHSYWIFLLMKDLEVLLRKSPRLIFWFFLVN